MFLVFNLQHAVTFKSYTTEGHILQVTYTKKHAIDIQSIFLKLSKPTLTFIHHISIKQQL